MTNGGRSAQPLRRGLPTGRLEALSDGVFAIAITLLVLDIAIPASAEPAAAAPARRVPAVPHPALFAEYIGHSRPESIAAAIYGVQPAGVLHLYLWVLWRYAVHARLVRADAGDEEVQLLTQRLTPGLGGYVILIAAGFFAPTAAVVGYLAIALYYVIPFRRFGRLRLLGPRRRRRDRPPA